ncbi:FecR family protein [uncultured Bacteroides sp.]|uniref:FecR family protein n=1 Tax=uncultured Bacteroides sp. TaxID=162156 RepID=UPI0026252CF4|nr:FecR family protein [uncultured Bacteroides sp.]
MENKDWEVSFRKAQALGDDIRELESIDVLASYQQSKVKIRSLKRMKLYNQLMRYAAFLSVPLLLTSLLFGYLYFVEPEEEIKYAEVTSTMGTVTRYELPDHTVVWLNSGTTLRYPTMFKKDNRSVELRGEAYFEVEADHKRPFWVYTPNGLRIYVYGTKFNVAAYDDDDYIETVLEKGMVNVVTPNHETIILTPGDQLLYDKHTSRIEKEKVDVYGKVAWKEGKMIFRNASLEEILKRLERHFNVDIEFNNHSGKTYNYRATFRNETLTQILDYLAKSANLKWKIQTPEQQEDDTLTKTKIIVNLY